LGEAIGFALLVVVYCRTHVETQAHFLTCADSLDQWNNALNNAKQSFGEKYQPLVSIIQWSLINCRDTVKPIPHDMIKLLPLNPALLTNQTEIGWRQLLMGRWAADWTQEIEQITPGQGERKMKKLTITIWQAILQV
jgi:hypothetical protein